MPNQTDKKTQPIFTSYWKYKNYNFDIKQIGWDKILRSEQFIIG